MTNDTKAPELLPCPFCGSEATHAKTRRGWKVECTSRMGSCYINARTHYQPHKHLASHAWNIRHDHAQAALDRMLQEEREKALREAAAASDRLGHHCIGCGHLCGDPDKDLSLLRKGGARSCCPEREMEPLSKAILALIEKDTP